MANRIRESNVPMTRFIAIGTVLTFLAATGMDEPPKGKQAALESREVPGIENVWRIDEKLWSGGDPGAWPSGTDRPAGRANRDRAVPAPRCVTRYPGPRSAPD